MTATTFQIWQLMMRRCYNPEHRNYYDYGGRGIQVCKSWQRYEGFLRSMGERPGRMTLDRIDTNGDYSRSNCRWVSMSENCNNKRNNRYIECMGIVMTTSEWEEFLDFKPKTIVRRLAAGWPIEAAVGTPIHSNNGRVKISASMVQYGHWRNVWHCGQIFRLAPGMSKARIDRNLKNISNRIYTGGEIIGFPVQSENPSKNMELGVKKKASNE
jgi:hypothetical protein